MDNQSKTVSKRLKIERIIIAVLCAGFGIGIVSVLLFAYKPNQNALGALASVCMDVICIVILFIMVINLAFEQKNEISLTTKLFLALMLGTMVAMFFDFLVWVSDGALEYGNWTYVFTFASLCSASLVACIFVLYLYSYLDDMYGMKRSLIHTKICVGINLFAFILTVVLAFTKTAFIFVDGHYETGVLYDLVTIVPVLTLVYITIYAVYNIKTIGVHDVAAVVGYISIMIIGASIETAYRIGTTYVGVTVADIFIFVMLQNKLFDRIERQKEVLSEKIASQYAILESMAGIYSHVNFIDLEKKTEQRFDQIDSMIGHLDLETEPHSILNKLLYTGIEDELKEKFWEFTDLSTLPERIKNEKIIASEFCHKKDGWFRAHYIRIGEDVNEPISKVIYAIRNIDEEKKNVEKWIRKSNTDELTGCFNRHGYEEEVASLEEEKIKDNFVYVSMDVNSLKIVNDTLGHDVGDELLVGASECLKQCFGPYGKLYRTGGDEFVALIYADDAQLETIKNDLEEITNKWSGKLIDSLAVSCGYVTRKEASKLTLHQMAILADKRMYEAKNRYYQQRGIDRRGQRDAHVALCALYTKILKINVTDDTYQIINMDDTERSADKGFSENLSQWFYDFGVSGQVHPEDLGEYLNKTNINYISNHFKCNKSSLSVFYRRKYIDGYKRVMLEMIPANDYTDELQTLFLYVKDIDE